MARMPGFTLTELMAGLAVAALLAVLAAPGFGTYLRNARQGAALNALVHAVHAARTVGGARGRPVGLCGSADGHHCTGSGDWSRGVLLRALDDGSPDGSRFTPMGDGRGRLSVRSNREVIEFRPLSRFATPATVTVCDDRGAAAARAVIVSRTGRPRVSDRDPGNRPLRCP